MNAVVLGRGLTEGWRGMLITAGSVAAMLALALWMYQDIDLGIYQAMPEAIRAVMGIPADADASMMAYNEMLGAIGGLAFTGVAIAIGARAVAGEEADRTLSVVLSAPVSRAALAASKAVAMFAVILVAGTLIYGLAELAPVLVGVDTGEAHVLAVMIHLTACGAFHGALAFAIGAATGRRSVASGVAAFVMVAGWLGNGLLPMWREGAADWIPWTWFNGSKPLVNGVDGGHLALLLGGAVLLVVLGTLAFARRELRLQQSGGALLSRLQANPMVAKVLAPTAAGSSFFGISMASQAVLLSYVVLILVLLGVSMPAMWNVLEDTMAAFAQSFPESMGALFGGGDLTSPGGFLHMEIFGLMAPICVILVAVAAASGGLAGEEGARRLALLLAAPMRRAGVYATVAAVMMVKSAIVAATFFLGMWGGLALARIDGVRLGDLAWACVLLMLLGWCFGALALALGVATGRSKVAVWGTTAVGVVTYFAYTMLLAVGKENHGWFSPFRAYLYGPPLQEGIVWWQPVWLVAATAVLLAVGLPLFLRRDLRLN